MTEIFCVFCVRKYSFFVSMQLNNACVCLYLGTYRVKKRTN